MAQRFLDYVYLTFFTIHIPIMFLVDLHAFWPASIRPAFMDSIREFYITTYADTFFTAPPPWFTSYLYMELLYHVPLSIWLLANVTTANPLVPLHLLVFALQAGLTTLTCLVDILGSAAYSPAQKQGLVGVYGGYLAFAVLAGLDNFFRVARQVTDGEKLARSGKKA